MRTNDPAQHLRTARAMPEHAHLYSIEFNADNAAIARRVLDHAGVKDRVTVVVGTLGDGGETLATLLVHNSGRLSTRLTLRPGRGAGAIRTRTAKAPAAATS